jgi:pyruvate formate lyase activating enzyme
MNEIVAKHWTNTENTESKEIKCTLCPHFCIISNNGRGICGVRVNKEGVLIAEGYGKVTSYALDPIEKKPLRKFHSGKKIVSVGGYGCNLRCRFCQNYNISMEYKNVRVDNVTPQVLKEVAIGAIEDNNIGIAYTYNEPLIGYEYVYDCATLTREAGLMNVLVTNGYINIEPLKELLPLIDAMNIDIKGFSDRTYNMVGGTLEPVKEVVRASSRACHVEVTTLVIPNENEDEVEAIAKWLSEINPDIPYHLSRFFPRYKYFKQASTPDELMYRLRDIASKYMKYVFLGNM